MIYFFDIFIFLLQVEKTTCKEIAKKFNMSTRNVYRIINKLSISIPIITIQGYSGGIMIMPEYKEKFLKQVKESI